MASVMKDMQASSNLYGANAPYVEELYERWLADPDSVEASWRCISLTWARRASR